MEGDLSTLLKKASEGQEAHIRDFFIALLSSTIFVPSKPGSVSTPTIGHSKTEDDTNYLFIDYEESRCTPIFSTEEFLKDWAESELPFIEEPFSQFLWKMPHNTWAYLNPGQEVGKELSPWELELLKLGEDSIDELISGVKETEQEDFEIEDATPILEKAKEPLKNILEAYPAIEECFLLSLKEGQSDSERALLGIRYNIELEDEKKDQIRNEFASALKDLVPKPHSEAFIVDDLMDPNSMNHTLFLDYPSFYKKV